MDRQDSYHEREKEAFCKRRSTAARSATHGNNSGRQVNLNFDNISLPKHPVHNITNNNNNQTQTRVVASLLPHPSPHRTVLSVPKTLGFKRSTSGCCATKPKPRKRAHPSARVCPRVERDRNLDPETTACFVLSPMFSSCEPSALPESTHPSQNLHRINHPVTLLLVLRQVLQDVGPPFRAEVLCLAGGASEPQQTPIPPKRKRIPPAEPVPRFCPHLIARTNPWCMYVISSAVPPPPRSPPQRTISRMTTKMT